jgi:histone-lysine N-methyltransferase SETMAR
MLKLRKVCAQWIPHLLTEDQKPERVQIASQLLNRYKNADQNRMNEIVTGDEIWVYFYEPDGKEESKVWVGENDKQSQIAQSSHLKTHYECIIF